MESQQSEQPPSGDEAHFEQEEEIEEEDIVESQQSMSRAQDDIFSKFLNMTKQFTELVEDTRKQQLMLRNLKSSGKKLPFDCMVNINWCKLRHLRRHAEHQSVFVRHRWWTITTLSTILSLCKPPDNAPSCRTK